MPEYLHPSMTRAGYVTNRAPLRSDQLIRLEPGAVTASGWIAVQLENQLNGLSGRLAEISDFIDQSTSGWANRTGAGWEELPYWIKGFGDLGYVTGDQRVLRETRQWIDLILDSQDVDGYFGPTELRTSLDGVADLWPHMPILAALRAHQEYSHNEEVLPFLLAFFRYMLDQPIRVFSEGWGSKRWADAIDSIYWTYNRSGEQWLLELVEKIHLNSADYVRAFPDFHNVNVAQGFREPAVYSTLTSDEDLVRATYDDYDRVMAEWGQFPGGGFAGDEIARAGYGDPRQGFEVCGVVEYMASHEILGRMTGDTVWADRVEDLAFNSLPAALDAEQTSIHYIVSANSVALLHRTGTHEQFQNSFPLQDFNLGTRYYRCCQHNYGQGWPYFVEEMWAATPDGGLAAVLHGPSTVNARVGDGIPVSITSRTDYPFSETISYHVTLESDTSFALTLRVPTWCDQPAVEINGRLINSDTSSGWIQLDRNWANGDEVKFSLPMQTKVRHWPANGNSVSIDRGPLTYSLDIEETWTRYAGTKRWPEREVVTGSVWNFGLDDQSLDAIEILANRPVVGNPFTHDSAPIRMSALARRIAGWQTDDEEIIETLPQSPVTSSALLESIPLIPMGSARLRISSFPLTTSQAADG